MGAEFCKAPDGGGQQEQAGIVPSCEEECFGIDDAPTCREEADFAEDYAIGSNVQETLRDSIRDILASKGRIEKNVEELLQVRREQAKVEATRKSMLASSYGRQNEVMTVEDDGNCLTELDGSAVFARCMLSDSQQWTLDEAGLLTRGGKCIVVDKKGEASMEDHQTLAGECTEFELREGRLHVRGQEGKSLRAGIVRDSRLAREIYDEEEDCPEGYVSLEVKFHKETKDQIRGVDDISLDIDLPVATEVQAGDAGSANLRFPRQTMKGHADFLKVMSGRYCADDTLQSREYSGWPKSGELRRRRARQGSYSCNMMMYPYETPAERSQRPIPEPLLPDVLHESSLEIAGDMKLEKEKDQGYVSEARTRRLYVDENNSISSSAWDRKLFSVDPHYYKRTHDLPEWRSTPIIGYGEEWTATETPNLLYRARTSSGGTWSQEEKPEKIISGMVLLEVPLKMCKKPLTYGVTLDPSEEAGNKVQFVDMSEKMEGSSLEFCRNIGRKTRAYSAAERHEIVETRVHSTLQPSDGDCGVAELMEQKYNHPCVEFEDRYHCFHTNADMERWMMSPTESSR